MRAHTANIGAGAPHELRGRAGVVGRVSLDALVGQRLKTHGRAGVLKLGLHGGNVNLGRIAGRDGVGIVARVVDVGRGGLFGCTVDRLVVLRGDGCRLGRREVRGRGRAVGLGDILRRCCGYVFGYRLHGFGRRRGFRCRCGLGCCGGCRRYGKHRCRGLGSRKYRGALGNRRGDGFGQSEPARACLAGPRAAR